MDATVQGRYVMVTLSKRNLEALLNKLDRTDSERTLVRATGTHVLFVKAEPDDVHYAGRKPGKVHPKDDPGTPKGKATVLRFPPRGGAPE